MRYIPNAAVESAIIIFFALIFLISILLNKANKNIAAKNIVGIILAVILLCTGGLIILWIVDIIMVIFGKKIWWID